jgi:putative oxidoreductase
MDTLRAVVTVVGRVLLVAIFALSVLNKIFNFSATAGFMEHNGVPAAPLMLVGAIVFLVVGSLSVLVGYRARFGAALLLVFLVLATYFFHAFWNFEGMEAQNQMAHFLKNVSIMGAMFFIIANGSGPASLDGRRIGRTTIEVDQADAGSYASAGNR